MNEETQIHEEKKYDLRESQITVWRNKTPQSENSPNFSGKLLLNGQLYRVVFWVKNPDMLSGQVDAIGEIKL